MKHRSSIVALATLITVLPAQAQQTPNREGRAPVVVHPLAVGDPLKLIYRISGVRDTGQATNVGVATTIHCTNFGSVSERVKYLVKGTTGDILANVTHTIGGGRTIAASTHFTALVNEEVNLTPGVIINPGSVTVSASSTEKIFCSAMIVDAASTVPQGIALHMVRFNPREGTEE